MPMTPSVVISPRGEDRLHSGHPWIYRADIVETHAAPGDIVDVVGPRRRRLGQAFFSDRSQIVLRMLTRGDEGADIALIRTRVRRAIDYRASLQIDASAYRLVHAEGDLLPSLIVDRYGDYLVVQTLSQGMDRLLDDVVSTLVELLHPSGVLVRNDPKVRRLEGLDQKVEARHGVVPPSVIVREGPLEYEADLWKGQKTGLFLDQRENREAAARYAHGRLLDCFTYNGGFALRLAPLCTSAEAVDISADAVVRVRANAERNGVSGLEVREANVFDELRRLERSGERYDTIVLDPPAFAKNRAALPGALAGYKEINLRAMHLLQPGGYLVTSSCSYNVSEDLFLGTVRAAASDSHAEMALVEKRQQSRDHPVLVSVAETHYLKCLILRRVE
jgi:23S rRNA (cytosine1962-C5)-methyltransferase